MRAPVYRNTDTPFQILGFRPLELTILCVAFVAGGELASLIAISRAWNLILTVFMALGLFAFRRSFGELFGRRLWRFARLPSELHARRVHVGRGV